MFGAKMNTVEMEAFVDRFQAEAALRSSNKEKKSSEPENQAQSSETKQLLAYNRLGDAV